MKKFDETYSVLTDKQCHVHTLTTPVGQDKRYLVSLFLNRCSLTSDMMVLGFIFWDIFMHIFEECLWFEINFVMLSGVEMIALLQAALMMIGLVSSERLVWSDEFESLDESVWIHEVTTFPQANSYEQS